MVALGKWDAEIVDRCTICGTRGQFVLKAPTIYDDIYLNVHICPKCNCTYNSPRMTEKSMGEFYSSGVYIDNTNKNRNGRGSFGERRRALRLMMILMNMTRIGEPARALDVGCSQGHFLERMKDHWFGIETVGYDLYRDPDRVHAVTVDKNLITGKFDLISCIHVLEHIYDPMAELEWMNSLLAEDGTLVLELPTVRYIMLEHPITFALDTVPVMMEHIGIENFTTMNFPELESCIVFGKK
jgi:SAM-dependent methyltransferase